MNQPNPSYARLQSAKRVAWLLFAVSVLGSLSIGVLTWLKVFDAEPLWAQVLWPLAVPALVIHTLIEWHQRNSRLFVRHLADTNLRSPSFVRTLAAAFADLLLTGVFIFVPACLSFPQIFDWASSRSVADKTWVPWALAMGVGWIVAFAASVHAYFDWLPTTRLQARPGLWLLRLRMTDLKGNRLKRRSWHAHLRGYVIVRPATVDVKPKPESAPL